jgi:hypothetical protein
MLQVFMMPGNSHQLCHETQGEAFGCSPQQILKAPTSAFVTCSQSAVPQKDPTTRETVR